MRLFQKSWVEWADYNAKITFRDRYFFEQKTRRESIKNIREAEE